MKTKKIGIISFYNLSKLNNGGKIRTYSLSNELSKLGHKVFLIMPSNSENMENVPNFEYLEVDVKNPTTYLKKIRFMRKIGLQYFKEKKIDLLITHLAWSLPIGLYISKKLNVPLILDEHNLEFKRALKMRKYARFLLSLYLELILAKKCKAICFVSKNEMQYLGFFLKKHIKPIYVPNATNFNPNVADIKNNLYYKDKIRERHNIPKNKKICLFIGDLTYSPNIKAVKTIKKLAKKLSSSVHFVVIGKKKSTFKNEENVTFTGYVKDISIYLYGSDFSINPVKTGGGTNLKVFDFLASGLPLISTSYGIRDIEIKEKSYVKICNSRKKFLEEIDLLVKEFDFKEKYKHIDNSYTWKNSLKDLVKFLEKQN